MPPPRRPLSSAEVDVICAAYSLGDHVRSDLVYEGTSSLYQTVCRSAHGSRAVALKVQDGGKSVSATKSFEARVLSAVRPAFRSVPVLLRPGIARLPMRAHEWGLTGGRFAISVYEWEDFARPWESDPEQRRATVAALGRLQRGLDAMTTEPGAVHDAESQPSILDIRFPGFVWEFGPSELGRRQVDPTIGLDQPQLSYLDDRFDALRQTFLDDWRLLARTSVGLAHADFTPGNCGYADNGALTIVFDFESVRLGVLPLFGAVTVGAFSVNHGSAAPLVIAAMREIVDGLRRSCPSLSPPPGLTLPLLRMAYLDAVRRQLHARKQNPVRRWGFLKEDVNNLRWLDQHGPLIADI